MNRVLQILFKRIVLLITGTLAGIALALLMFVNFTAERYEAKAVILINNDSIDTEGLVYEDLLGSQRLAEYFSYFFHRGIYHEEAYRMLSITPDDYKGIYKTLQVEVEKNTGIIEVTLHNGIDTDSIKHLQAISNIMVVKFKELTGVSNVKVISITQTEESVRRELMIVFILAGLLGGLAVSSVLAVILENASNTIKSAEDAGKFFNIPVLGVIPRINVNGREKNAGQAL